MANAALDTHYSSAVAAFETAAGIDVSLSPLGVPARDQLSRDVTLLQGRVAQVIADANAARAALTEIYIGVTGVSTPALAGGAVTTNPISWDPGYNRITKGASQRWMCGGKPHKRKYHGQVFIAAIDAATSEQVLAGLRPRIYAAALEGMLHALGFAVPQVPPEGNGISADDTICMVYVCFN